LISNNFYGVNGLSLFIEKSLSSTLSFRQPFTVIRELLFAF